MTFYAYVYVEPLSGEPFYVGKGFGNRSQKHLSCRGPNKRLRNKIKGILTHGDVPGIHIYPCANEAAAFELERLLIAAFGRKDLGAGPLLNYTDGGEGSSGRHWFRHTEETKARIAQSMRGKVHGVEALRRASDGRRGKPPSPDAIEKMKQTTAARRHTYPKRGRTCSDEHLAEMTRRAAELKRGTRESEVTRRKKSEAMKRHFSR